MCASVFQKIHSSLWIGKRDCGRKPHKSKNLIESIRGTILAVQLLDQLILRQP